MRVKSYIRRVTYVDKGVNRGADDREDILDFNEMHAAETSTVLESDGISVAAAERLIAKWNAIGNYGDVIYSYNLHF